MVKEAGQTVYDGRTVSFESDGDVSKGDIVELAGDTVSDHDAGTAIGVVSDQTKDDHEAGDKIPVHVTGVVIAAVPGGTAGGDDVAGEFVAFSDEGGEFKGASIADGYAAVHLG